MSCAADRIPAHASLPVQSNGGNPTALRRNTQGSLQLFFITAGRPSSRRHRRPLHGCMVPPARHRGGAAAVARYMLVQQAGLAPKAFCIALPLELGPCASLLLPVWQLLA